ncbi:MAG TPA: lytic transglycosylase domain-containing protein [Syntrophorhabdaceae bacterium]|nr:lytic transglycosylase domain-containing protein [Syntrophorhabdaceae bacterium]
MIRGKKTGDSITRLFNHVVFLILSSIFILFIVLPLFTVDLFAQTPPKRTNGIEKRLSELEKEVLRLKKETDFYNLSNLPDKLILCDKKIPLQRDDIRERFEREILQFLENKGLLVILIKRYYKYQGLINEEIKRLSMPPDLVFLVIAESYLNPRALSKANAAGLWQFIKETGKKEGLYIDDTVDERYNLKRATRSALNHLKKLNEEFNDWLIAMAAYNAGAGRLREAIANQNTRDFFDLFLPEETERYIFRIISLKEVILNRERYGIRIDEKTFYKPVGLKEVVIETSKEMHITVLSESMALPFKTFRDYNLHLRRYRLPKGVYSVNVPTEKQALFIKNLNNYPYIRVIREK